MVGYSTQYKSQWPKNNVSAFVAAVFYVVIAQVILKAVNSYDTMRGSTFRLRDWHEYIHTDEYKDARRRK